MPEGAPTRYLTDLVRELPSAIKWADIVHLTGTYSFPTLPCLLFARMQGKPLAWALSGALLARGRPSTRAAKRVWVWAARRVLPKRCVLHVTSPEEGEASARRISSVAVCVIEHGVDLPPRTSRGAREGVLRVLFLGRIDPIKRVEVLIQACTLAHGAGISVTLDIAGDGEPAYCSALVSLACKSLPPGSVRWLGFVNSEAREDAFRNADVLALPSETESFGMAVAEALA